MNFFKTKKVTEVSNINEDQNIIDMWQHNSWGDLVDWVNWDKRILSGFLRNKPKNGDILRCKMNSGKIARFTIKNVEYKSDPRDMFFAEADDLGYEE